MSNTSKKGFNGHPQAINRRKSVITRLENQLHTGVKPALKPARGVDETLSDKDIERIKKELSILKTRI